MKSEMTSEMTREMLRMILQELKSETASELTPEAAPDEETHSFRAEQRLILELLRGRDFSDGTIKALARGCNRSYILGKLAMHRVAAAAYKQLADHGLQECFGRVFCNALEDLYEESCYRCKAYNRDLGFLAIVLQNAEFPYALLSGAYAPSVYERGTRLAENVDILINPEDLPALKEILHIRQYQQGHYAHCEWEPDMSEEIADMWECTGEITPFFLMTDTWAKRYQIIQITYTADKSPMHPDDPAADEQKRSLAVRMLSHRRPAIITNDGRLYTLDRVDFLLHLCMRFYFEATSLAHVEAGTDLSLQRLLDLLKFWQGAVKDEHLPVLKKRLAQYGVQDAFSYAYTFVSRLWDLDDLVLKRLLAENTPSSPDWMQMVYDRTGNRCYQYEETDLISRVFAEKRRKMLREV